MKMDGSTHRYPDDDALWNGQRLSLHIDLFARRSAIMHTHVVEPQVQA